MTTTPEVARNGVAAMTTTPIRGLTAKREFAPDARASGRRLGEATAARQGPPRTGA